jgi:hypothetical protein
MFGSLVFMVRSAPSSPGSRTGPVPERLNSVCNLRVPGNTGTARAIRTLNRETARAMPQEMQSFEHRDVCPLRVHLADQTSRTAPATATPQLTLSALHARGQKKNARPEKTSFDVQTNGRYLHDARAVHTPPAGSSRIIQRRRLRLPPRRPPCLPRRHIPRGGYRASSG